MTNTTREQENVHICVNTVLQLHLCAISSRAAGVTAQKQPTKQCMLYLPLVRPAHRDGGRQHEEARPDDGVVRPPQVREQRLYSENI
jgi:hypothetical protein